MTERPSTVYRVAARTWWMPWLIGTAVVVVGTVTAMQLLTAPGEPEAESRAKHRIGYEVTGTAASEIKYVTDGVRGIETVTRTQLPWRLELPVEVGPGLGVVQVMASRADGGSPLSCSLTVDGRIAQRSDAMPGWSSVSCSAVIRGEV